LILKALPDVNVLIALLDEDHPHHDTAANWFVLNSELGWATCPLTQNGCIRILSQTRYPNSLSIGEVVEGLRAVTLIKSHEFIADDVSLLNQGVVDVSSISSHRQLTDIYLLALAVEHDMRFVTLDRGVPLEAVSGASAERLVVI
jgi:toxin-antitoxin system PIN domain toxin